MGGATYSRMAKPSPSKAAPSPHLSKLQMVFTKATDQSLRMVGHQELIDCHREGKLEATEQLREVYERFHEYVTSNMQHEFELILAERDVPRRFIRLAQLMGSAANAKGEPVEDAAKQAQQVAVEQKAFNLEQIRAKLEQFEQ